jgi:hypothetical protein
MKNFIVISLIWRNRPSQTAAREPNLAPDDFEFEKFIAFSLKQLKKFENLNKILRNLLRKFNVCKIVSSRLTFIENLALNKKVCEGLVYKM